MASSSLSPAVRERLRKGVVIPAHPLALTADRKLDERRQRALTRYYLAAGAGGLAVGVHTTQFAIRDAGLYRPVLELAAEEDRRFEPLTIKVAGVCGPTKQAVAEASLARELGYDLGLLSLAALKDATDDQLVAHARAVADVIPLFGFYLQPSVGGRVLSYGFWRRFVEIPNVAAIKMAPFNRYQTIDVVRAVAESGRAGEIALYTGNDDNILVDLLTEYRFGEARLRIVGGLLGHWSVWTRRAVELLNEVREAPEPTAERLTRAVEITDSNAAFFDAANGYHGCIAGLHEVLRRQGLLEGIWCLDPKEGLSPGQKEEIDRVYRAYPHLNDDAFVARHRDEWLV
jgi:dihydrodipicolinate synthase/N-acetylneuraminate lyase